MIEPNLLANAPSRPPRLLLVDDQRVNIHALHKAFSSDYQIFMATDGEHALAMCAAKQPDLVLLDVEMPGMDGYEVCRRLKSDPATSDIPVIFVTAHTDEASEERGLDVGAVDFITKPVRPKIVRARVKTHLALKAQADLLRRWAYLDGLTGVPNRRHFDEMLATEWGRAQRGETALSVVLLDVDFFKRYNDHYGHLAGDDCLRRIAAALKAGLKRPGDVVARYGGEEFVCVLPETDLAGAMQVAEHLGRQVQALQIAHAESTVAPNVTVSLGVRSRPAGPLSPAAQAAQLLAQADEQLYLAKTTGRARVCGALMTLA